MKRLPEQAPARTPVIGRIGKRTNQRTVGQTAKSRAGRSKSSHCLGAPFRRLAKLSYGAAAKDNALIHAENMCALQSLQETFAGRVRCIYIDPPYNNQERYRHYLDKQGHEEWLSATMSRLELLRPLLCQNGSLWISIDDREMHYLKVAADQILGRRNFVSTIVWQQRTTRENRKVFSNNHEYLLVYAIDSQQFKAFRNPLPAGAEQLARYKNPDSDPRGSWQSISANVQDGHSVLSQHYEIVAPNGSIHRAPDGRCWVYTKAKMQKEIAAGNIWFGKDGSGVPRIKGFLNGHKLGLTPETLWTADEVGTSDEAKKQLLQLFPDKPVFDTPKPERLLSRVIEIATDEGDLVLDAYLGSGTTAAVAHKMNRRYVGIEQGVQAVTHCASRLRVVVDGDPTGISPMLGWRGGGGFSFYKVQA